LFIYNAYLFEQYITIRHSVYIDTSSILLSLIISDFFRNPIVEFGYPSVYGWRTWSTTWNNTPRYYSSEYRFSFAILRD